MSEKPKCEHGSSEFIDAIQNAGELYFCPDCGGLIDIADKRTGYGERILTAGEISELILAEINERLRTARQHILGAINAELPFDD